jgi:hypothetical protein
MKTAEIHNCFSSATTYTWIAKVTLRHIDPAKDNLVSQFGGTDRFSDPYEAEMVIGHKIIDGSKVEFPAYAIGDIEIVRFLRASDASL